MSLQVVGNRVLVRVKKYSVKKDSTFEGTSILMPEDKSDWETANQTIGEIVQVGNDAYKSKSLCPSGEPWVKPGDKIHFSRYGAMRINTKSSEDYEYWVLMDRDILVIEKEEAKENVAI
jgi:co-chaperonin GroES (HSP10)